MLLWFIRKCAFSAAAMLMLVPAAGAAMPALCVSGSEKQALDTRVLQTELMVAGLSCGLTHRYNAFVINFRPQLKAHGAQLSALFDRLHGRGAQRRLNTFVTNLANDASKRSQLISYGYCHYVNDIFAEAIQTPPGDFQRLTDRSWIGSRHGYRTCQSS